MLRDGWRIKANTDMNADAKNVYSFLEQHAAFPAIPTYLLSTSHSVIRGFTYSPEIQVWHFYLHANPPAISDRFPAFSSRHLLQLNMRKWRASGACCVIGISSNKNIPRCIDRMLSGGLIISEFYCSPLCTSSLNDWRDKREKTEKFGGELLMSLVSFVQLVKLMWPFCW